MELIKGDKYLYTNTVKVGRNCKRTKKQSTVVYIGKDGNKEVFETVKGTEILLHTSDIEKFISQ